jgi:DNA mismatch endonuclease (patch repair protein)
MRGLPGLHSLSPTQDLVTDIVSPAKRSLMMSGIRGRDTGPEMRVRRLLHARGYRFRLHCRDLPGSPDLVLPKHRVVVFVHGCFWHFHAGCRLAKVPGSRPDFWRTKLLGNRARDAVSIDALQADGWRVLVVWECWLRATRDDEVAAEAIAAWMRGGQSFSEFSGELVAVVDG